MGLFDDFFKSKKENTRTINSASKTIQKSQVVLLNKRTLSNTSSVNRAFGSSVSVRSSNSTIRSGANLPASAKQRKIDSSTTQTKTSKISSSAGRKIDTKPETTRRWLLGSKPKQPAVEATRPRRPIKSTSTDLRNNNNHEVKTSNLKRPYTVNPSEYAGVKRGGQTQVSSKFEQGHINENLSRSSSVTNLNAEHKNKGAFSKLRNSASKDRLDKLTDKKNDKKGNNNNKLDSVDVDQSLESIQEIEILQRQLLEMAKEKSDLALELGERKGELQLLKSEIVKLKSFQDQSSFRIEQLNDENTTLRNRLRDVSHSPLSDNEKQQLLLESQRHSSAPASIATNLLDEGTMGDVTACTTPDWDKHSSGNVSEVSVACLQDKINQMQETHYSTNEELQATLQELTDLQKQLTELQQDNERLSDEKNLMFDSLCRQTERLNDSRSEVESLKQLLYRDKDESGQLESIVDREQKLVDLLKSAQEERESLLVKQEQLNNELQDISATNMKQGSLIDQLSERVRTLESTLDAKHAEHRQLDQELAIAKDQCSVRQIEINRLVDHIDNARTKINELEQERALNDKSELDELLDNARKEKDTLESEVANLKEQIARSRNETDKLREQVSTLQEECKVTRNNAKCTQSELEYKCEKLSADKVNLTEQLQQLQEAANELQVQAQCQLEDKRQLSFVLSETQRNLSETERKNSDLSSEVEELNKLRKEEIEEWEKFQDDLLTSVRVANDFKSEAQQELQKMIMENKAHRERIRQLESQVDKFKGDPKNATQLISTTTDQSATNEIVTLRPNSFPNDDLTLQRQKITLNRQNSRQSVKSLIESIENAGKPVSKSGLSNNSRSSSSSSLNSIASDLKTPSSPTPIITPSLSPGSPLRTSSDWSESVACTKTPLKEQQPNKQSRDWSKSVITDSLVKSDKKSNMNGKLEESMRDTILQTAKGIDYSRRNSYSDICERKDPLNGLVKNGGSKRNALLKWCQNKTVGYRNIDITNFSSSWNDGLALCAILHTYLPDRVPYDTLAPQEKRRNFSIAFTAAESVGVPTTLNITDMIQLERPDWQQVMAYVTAIYKHFES